MLFMSTGYGRGCFNIFTGMFLFFSNDDDGILNANNIAGAAITFCGFVFLFLSKFKDLSESDLDRHASA